MNYPSTMRRNFANAISLTTVLAAGPAFAQAWQPIPLITAASLQAGHTGGEGGQAIRCLVNGPADPNFALMGTDVGGIYRSLDGGLHWQVCMVGWHSRGGNFFAVDPKNANRVIGLGANGGDWNSGWGASPNGMYISTDKAASWKLVYPTIESSEWRVNSLAFDPSSYDGKAGYCKVVYWLTRDNGLNKSVDGGETWAQVSKAHGSGQIKIHPTKGYVYIADSSEKERGFYRSMDGGVTFQKMNGEKATTLDVVATRPDSVYIGGPKIVLVSTDSGVTFVPAGAAKGLPDKAELRVLNIDPADPKNMVCNHGGAQWWESYSYYTTDGGENWARPVYDPANHFLPMNHDGNRFAFHPTKPHMLLNTSGSGLIVRSVDGGKTYQWSNDGENAIMQGDTFGFSPTSPKNVFLSFQDFNAAASPDGGRSWTYLNPAGNDWGGYEYGGFTVDGKIMWTGDAPGWYKARTLKVSRDSGATWTVAKTADGKDITFEGDHISYSDTRDPNVLFASNWRSADKGLTWSKMTGCEGVYTSNPTGAADLYGRHGNKVCKSTDHGATWTDVTTYLSAGLRDIAYDHIRDRFYVASGDRLAYFQKGEWYTLALPKDFKGSTHAQSVAVDPGNPDLVYTCGPSNLLATDVTVSASTDAGNTWTNLTVTTPPTNGQQPGGPHEVTWVRVHPTTHELWAAGECYGMWKISAAAVKTYAATALKVPGNPTLVPKAAAVTVNVGNGEMTEGADKPKGWEGTWGDIKSARDTIVFKSAPASFRVYTDGKKGQGSGFQTLNAPAGTKFTLSGWIKSKGATAQCAVQSFNGNWNPISFKQVKWIGADTDWTEFKGEVTLPDGTANFTIVLLVDGTGEGWMDDIRITDVQGP